MSVYWICVGGPGEMEWSFLSVFVGVRGRMEIWPRRDCFDVARARCGADCGGSDGL